MSGRIFCCAGTPCLATDSEAVKKEFEKLVVSTPGLEVRESGCIGLCSRAPMVRVELPDGSDALYESVTPDLVPRIVATVTDEASPPPQLLDQQTPFFTRQVRIVTANAGHVDPERIEDYLAVGGYDALNKAVTSATPQDVVAEVTRSGLRGRGGAGFPPG